MYETNLCSSKTYQKYLAIVQFLRKLLPKRMLNRQKDKFISCGLEGDHHTAEISPTTTTTKKMLSKSEHFSKKYRGTNIKIICIQKNCITSPLEILFKKSSD